MMYQSCKAKRLDDKPSHKCRMPLEAQNQNYRAPKYGDKDVDDGDAETITTDVLDHSFVVWIAMLVITPHMIVDTLYQCILGQD